MGKGKDFSYEHKLNEVLQSKGSSFKSWFSHIKAVWFCMSVFKPFKPQFLPRNMKTVIPISFIMIVKIELRLVKFLI